MPISQIQLYLLASISFGVALVVAHLLLLKPAQERRISLPLALFFLAFAISELPHLAALGVALQQAPAATVFGDQAPRWMRILTALGFSAVIAFGPLIWCYVSGLTSDTKRRPNGMIWHFAPAGFAGLIGVAYTLLPHDVMSDAPIADDLPYRGLTIAVAVSLLALTLFYHVQIGFYAFSILRRLMSYRKRLKDLFASTEARELRWISMLTITIISFWAAAIVNLITGYLDSNPFWAVAEKFLGLLALWALAVWGLRQRPVFLTTQPVPSQKYTRSALSDEQSQRIAKKINAAMARDRLHRKPDLSLWDLSKHIGASENYVSQTLNETIGESFFDYINKWRIKDAVQQIETTGTSIMDIAYDVGFNSRSSFYKAFKREIGGTPGALKRGLARPTG